MRRKLYLTALVLISLAGTSHFASAQVVYEVDPIVVTADRISQRARDALSSLTVITRKEIEAMHSEDLGDILRLAPGVQVQQYGWYGNLTQIRLRGSESSHILVMVNGVEVNDPFSGGLDVAHLSADEIERVEIVRGTQTAIYGADAIGGVVNIILREGAGQDNTNLDGEVGEHGFKKITAGTGGQRGEIGYAVHVSHAETDGLNQRDGYHNTSASAIAKISARSNSVLSFGLLYSEYYKELPFSYFWSSNDMNYRQYIDPNNVQEGELLTSFAQVTHVLKERFKSTLRLGLSYNRLRNTNSPDIDPGFEDTSLNTRKLDLLLDERVNLSDFSSLLLSWQWQDESASRLDNSLYSAFSSLDRGITTSAVSASLHLNAGDWLRVLAGARSDNPSLFSARTSPELKAAIRFPRVKTRIRSGWSKGFRIPTLSDLYFPNYGNPKLHPETAESFEVGIEQPVDLLDRTIFSKARLSVVFFKLNVRDKIAFNELTWISENIAQARYSGMEVSYESMLGSRGVIRTSYTHQRTRGLHLEEEKRLTRRPQDTFNLFLACAPVKSFEISGEYLSVGEQLIALSFITYDGKNVRAGDHLPAYNIVNLGLKYTLHPDVRALGGSSLYIRVMNVLNTSYEEIKGYPAPGRTVIAGIHLKM